MSGSETQVSKGNIEAAYCDLLSSSLVYLPILRKSQHSTTLFGKGRNIPLTESLFTTEDMVSHVLGFRCSFFDPSAGLSHLCFHSLAVFLDGLFDLL